MGKRSTRWVPITVQFASDLGSSKTQLVLLQRLRSMLDDLKEQGFISDSKVDVVFPDDDDPDLARIFVANIQGNSDAAARALSESTGIDYAAVSPERKT